MKTIYVMFFLTLFMPNLAHAYLDGGSASMLVQLLLGGVAGAAAIVKLYWYKIRSFFSKNK